jgi:Protein of unknown function (DUF3574)
MVFMRHILTRSLRTLAITVSILVFATGDAAAQIENQRSFRPIMRRPIPAAALRGSVDFVRSELYFGTAQPDGVVTDLEFNEFLDRIITPRFPDGLTLLKGDGQFRNEAGQIIKEDSFVLILFYPLEDFRDSSRKINAIRERYKTEFQQGSVLRVDDPYAVRVSF